MDKQGFPVFIAELEIAACHLPFVNKTRIQLTKIELGQPFGWLMKLRAESPLLAILRLSGDMFCQSLGSVLKFPLYYVCSHVHTYIIDDD